MFPSVTCEPEGTFSAWLHFVGELIGSDFIITYLLGKNITDAFDSTEAKKKGEKKTRAQDDKGKSRESKKVSRTGPRFYYASCL